MTRSSPTPAITSATTTAPAPHPVGAGAGAQTGAHTGAHTARALAALGHDARLGIFRLLVRAGAEGLRVGDIGEHLGLAPSTLAHHLSSLVDAGLVVQDRQGREVINRVDFAAMNRVVGFLTSECCVGVTIRRAEDAA